jgi:uncharacterized BrkB/YihY/UPF0761 family membrane protein
LLRTRLLSFGFLLGVGFLLLLWVYYSSQIFLPGAEFTHRYALAHRPRGAADGHGAPHAASPMS